MQTVFERIRSIVVAHLRCAPECVTDDARWGEDLGADDLERIEIVMAVEEAFGRDIPDEAIETFATVGDLARWLVDRGGFETRPCTEGAAS